MNHIKAGCMWDYLHLRLELNSEEEVHISECPYCLNLFKLCLMGESPDDIDLYDQAQQRAA